jgi:hypothetical protein
MRSEVVAVTTDGNRSEAKAKAKLNSAGPLHVFGGRFQAIDRGSDRATREQYLLQKKVASQ